MRIKSIKTNKKKIINSYDNKGFVISNYKFLGPVLISSENAVSINIINISNLTIQMLKPLTIANPHIDLLILGFSKAIEKELDILIRNYLVQNKISIEFMETGPACRTYNLLIAEERRVAALLLPVK